MTAVHGVIFPGVVDRAAGGGSAPNSGTLGSWLELKGWPSAAKTAAVEGAIIQVEFIVERIDKRFPRE